MQALARLGGGADGLSSGLDFCAKWADGSWEDGTPRVAAGVPDRARRLKALGNSVVPQLVELLGRAIVAYEREITQERPSTSQTTDRGR